MRHGAAYASIDVSYPYKMRGTNQQTNDGLLWQPPSYKAWAAPGGAAGPTTYYGPGMALGYFALHNRSASSGIIAGIGVRIPNHLWIAGKWTNATTTYTDDTADAQNTTTGDFPLETSATNNDGFIVASRVPFNAISINVGTADTGGSPARAVRFATAAGTAWQTAETNLFIHDASGSAYTTGEQLIVVAPPVDWGRSAAGLATGLVDGLYAMNVRATTAPTTAALANSLEVFRMYYVTEGLSDNATLLEEFSGRELLIGYDDKEGLYGDALVALFSVSNDMNRVTVQVRAA